MEGITHVEEDLRHVKACRYAPPGGARAKSKFLLVIITNRHCNFWRAAGEVQHTCGRRFWGGQNILLGPLPEPLEPKVSLY